MIRLHAGLFIAHVLLHQVCQTGARIATSYRAVEMQLPDIWIGAIAAAFNLRIINEIR